MHCVVLTFDLAPLRYNQMANGCIDIKVYESNLLLFITERRVGFDHQLSNSSGKCLIPGLPPWKGYLLQISSHLAKLFLSYISEFSRREYLYRRLYRA